MSRLQADKNKTVFLYESGTYASTSGTGHWVGLVQDFSADENEGVFEIRYQGGTRSVQQFVDGPKTYSVSATYYPQDWKFLGFALGSVVDSGSPSPYTHTAVPSSGGNAFTSGTDCPEYSFTIEHTQEGKIPDGDSFKRTFTGGMLNEYTVNFSQGEIVSCDMSLIAQGLAYSSGNATAVTANTDRPFVASDLDFELGGTSLTSATSVSFTVSQGLDAKQYLDNTRTIGVPVPGNREFMLDVTADNNDATAKTVYDTYVLGGSEFNCKLTVTDAGAGAGSRDGTLTLSGCQAVTPSATGGIEGANELSFQIKVKDPSFVANDTIEKYNPW